MQPPCSHKTNLSLLPRSPKISLNCRPHEQRYAEMAMHFSPDIGIFSESLLVDRPFLKKWFVSLNYKDVWGYICSLYEIYIFYYIYFVQTEN